METTLTSEAITGAWIDAAEASRRLGISVRAVQRRCKNGQLEARLVPVASGQQWEINPATLANIRPDTRDTNDGDTSDDDSDRYDTDDRVTNARQDHQPENSATPTTETTQTPLPYPDTTTGTTQDAATVPTGTTLSGDTYDGSDSDTRDRYDTPTATVEADLRLQLSEKREEISFLRGLIEQRDRDAAELRATLRKLVEAQPKQLGQGIPSGESSAVDNATAASPTEQPEVEPSATKAPPTAGQGIAAPPQRESIFKKWFGKKEQS